MVLLRLTREVRSCVMEKEVWLEVKNWSFRVASCIGNWSGDSCPERGSIRSFAPRQGSFEGRLGRRTKMQNT